MDRSEARGSSLYPFGSLKNYRKRPVRVTVHASKHSLSGWESSNPSTKNGGCQSRTNRLVGVLIESTPAFLSRIFEGTFSCAAQGGFGVFKGKTGSGFC